MAAGTIDPRTMSTTQIDTGPRKKTYVVERPRFPLVWKLFGLTALLIVIVVGVAVGITIERANRVASETVNRSILGAATLFDELEKQRLGRLSLPAELLGNDPKFVAYIQEALMGAGGPVAPAGPAIDLTSIGEQIEQRRQAFNSDLVILLDDQGRVIARTDQPNITKPSMEDLYEGSPLVKSIVDDNAKEAEKGVMPLAGRLYHAAVVPLGVGAPRVRVGYLINAYAIDDTFASHIQESTNAAVMFVPSPKVGNDIARSPDAPREGMEQMAVIKPLFSNGKTIPPTDVQVDRSRYVITAKPLLSAKQTVGAAVFLRNLDRELAPFKQIENALLLGGGLALLFALLFSWLIAKRVTHPIEELAGLAQAVTAGDYSVHPNIDRSDEVGILGRSFAQMITSLRDKSELEELYERMSAIAEEREAAVPRAAFEAARFDEGTVLVTDLRGLTSATGEADASALIATVSRVMKIQEGEVNRQDGNVREVVGNRLVSVFRGDRGIIHAIRAARAINEELASQPDTKQMSLGVGVATGEFVTGSVELSSESGLAIVGDAPLLASLFAWHAPAGHAYISYETAQTAGGDIMQQATREEVKLRWLAQPLAVASMPLASLTTSVMRSIGASTTSAMATLRIDGTSPGATAPSGIQVDLPPGAMFATRYRIEQVLGRGGMGVVYKATDTQLDETVAIKTLSGDVMSRSPEELERFKREIRLARKITHRNILRTYDYGEAEGVYFISMEFVRGYALSELLEESEHRQMVPRLTMGISRQICRGLQAAHEQGIIHRDIKPQNVLIDHKGEVKLMDFGIARMAEAHEGMTQAGLIVGTPHYMSPEQVQGKQLDPRSDVYSMGVLLYEMLVGEKPFISSSLTGVLTAHITEAPRPPIERKPDIGREINAIVMRCLAKDPKERYSDAGALLADLDRVQAPTSSMAAA